MSLSFVFVERDNPVDGTGNDSSLILTIIIIVVVLVLKQKNYDNKRSLWRYFISWRGWWKTSPCCKTFFLETFEGVTQKFDGFVSWWMTRDTQEYNETYIQQFINE